MKQLKNLASVLTVVLALAAAFAFNQSPKFTTTYGVKSENTTHWQVTNLTGLIPGEDYRCDPLAPTCTITTDTPPVNGQIPKTATVTKTDGKFVELP